MIGLQKKCVYLKRNLFILATSLLCDKVYGQNSRSVGLYAINVNALNDFVCSSNEIDRTDYNVFSQLQCFHSCFLSENCEGFFYHQGDMSCTLCKERYKHTINLQSYIGTKYYRPIASTCAEYSIFNGVTNGVFNIMVDPDGFEAQFTEITIQCDLDSDPGKAITIMRHNKETRTHVNGYEDCHSYRVAVTYNVGFEAVQKIMDASTACKQYVKYECYGSEMYYSLGKCTAWENRFQTLSSYFTGDGSTTTYCDCVSAGTCSDPYGCQCNYNDEVWRYDEGYVTNKAHLPITAFTAGDTGSASEEAYHTIGPLLCW